MYQQLQRKQGEQLCDEQGQNSQEERGKAEESGGEPPDLRRDLAPFVGRVEHVGYSESRLEKACMRGT